MTFGDSADVQAEIELLKQLHRDVRGTGAKDFADTRYSALNPDAWKWVAASGTLAWQHLPRRLTLTPLAHNRFRYEKIRARYKSLQLDSFAASA